jgi:hypothetical protein
MQNPVNCPDGHAGLFGNIFYGDDGLPSPSKFVKKNSYQIMPGNTIFFCKFFWFLLDF